MFRGRYQSSDLAEMDYAAIARTTGATVFASKTRTGSLTRLPWGSPSSHAQPCLISSLLAIPLTCCLPSATARPKSSKATQLHDLGRALTPLSDELALIWRCVPLVSGSDTSDEDAGVHSAVLPLSGSAGSCPASQTWPLSRSAGRRYRKATTFDGLCETTRGPSLLGGVEIGMPCTRARRVDRLGLRFRWSGRWRAAPAFAEALEFLVFVGTYEITGNAAVA
jgi:hypothetical protein